MTIVFLMLQATTFILAVSNCVAAQVPNQVSVTASSVQAAVLVPQRVGRG